MCQNIQRSDSNTNVNCASLPCQVPHRSSRLLPKPALHVGVYTFSWLLKKQSCRLDRDSASYSKQDIGWSSQSQRTEQNVVGSIPKGRVWLSWESEAILSYWVTGLDWYQGETEWARWSYAAPAAGSGGLRSQEPGLFSANNTQPCSLWPWTGQLPSLHGCCPGVCLSDAVFVYGLGCCITKVLLQLCLSHWAGWNGNQNMIQFLGWKKKKKR